MCFLHKNLKSKFRGKETDATWMCTKRPYTDFVTVTNATVDRNQGIFQCVFKVAQCFADMNKNTVLLPQP